MAKTAMKVVRGKAMTLYGIPELKKALNSLAQAIGPEGMGELREEIKQILMKPALVIRDEARDMAPERTGNLKASIYASAGPDNLPGVVVGINFNKAWYARLVEFGSVHNTPNPFFRPAVNAVRGTIASMIAPDLKRLVEDYITKVAK